MSKVIVLGSMPEVISKYIQLFAKPITRLDWKKGGAFSSYLFYEGLYEAHDIILYHYYMDIDNEMDYIHSFIYERAIELRGTRYKRHYDMM